MMNIKGIAFEVSFTVYTLFCIAFYSLVAAALFIVYGYPDDNDSLREKELTLTREKSNWAVNCLIINGA